MKPPITAGELKNMLSKIGDDRVIVLNITEEPDDTPEYSEDDDHDLRGVIRKAGLTFKGARQVDGEDRDLCVITLTTSHY